MFPLGFICRSIQTEIQAMPSERVILLQTVNGLSSKMGDNNRVQIYKLDIDRDSTNSRALEIIDSFHTIFKNEIMRSQIAYVITICERETDIIEKKNIIYTGLSAPKTGVLVRRLQIHKRSSECYAENLSEIGHFQDNPDMYKAMAAALNDGKSVRIFYFEFRFPTGTIEDSFMKSFKPKHNRVAASQNGYHVVTFNNPVNYNSIGEIFVENQANCTEYKPVKRAKTGKSEIDCLCVRCKKNFMKTTYLDTSEQCISS